VYVSLGTNTAQQRIHKSVDGGRRFRLLGHPGSGLPPGEVYSLAIDPAGSLEARTIYAAVTGYGVFRSDDGGLHWQEKTTGLPADSRNAVQVALDPAAPATVWLCASAHYHRDTRLRRAGYIARSDDRGEHWRVLKAGIEPQCLLLDPHDSKRVYVGNRNFSGVDYPQAFYRTVDGGETWESFEQTSFLADRARATVIRRAGLRLGPRRRPLTPGHLSQPAGRRVTTSATGEASSSRSTAARAGVPCRPPVWPTTTSARSWWIRQSGPALRRHGRQWHLPVGPGAVALVRWFRRRAA